MTVRGWALIAVSAGLIFAHAAGAVAQDIELPRTVPAFNQAYNDGPDAWGNCGLGTSGCPDEICVTGCLVTAFASVLAYYDIELDVPARDSCTGEARTGMDPGILNDWLRTTKGYGRCSQDPVGNCCLIWEQLPAEIEITTHVNRSDVSLNPVSAVVIDHALRQGNPVIAGVHWGASCNGGAGQSEDCHWVVLTGKRGDTYTIMDPYNPDPTSPFGVRTTLDAGVRGTYIIDRFVVVERSSYTGMTLSIDVTPKQDRFSVGDRVALTVNAGGDARWVLPYVRVVMPSGRTMYAIRDTSSPDNVRFSATRLSFVSTPMQLPWTWYTHTLRATDVGTWTWEVWTESPGQPGVELGHQAVRYEVTVRSGSAIWGILLVLAIAAAAIVSTLGAAQE